MLWVCAGGGQWRFLRFGTRRLALHGPYTLRGQHGTGRLLEVQQLLQEQDGLEVQGNQRNLGNSLKKVNTYKAQRLQLNTHVADKPSPLKSPS